MSFEPNSTNRNRKYPKHVLHLRTEVLELNRTDFGHESSITQITALTDNQIQLINFCGKHRNDIPTWTSEVKATLSKELNANGMKYSPKHRKIFIGEEIQFTLFDIEVITADKQLNTKHEEVIRRQGKYYFNYGSQEFVYYGIGLEELQSAWETIWQVVSCMNCPYVIYTIIKPNR